jgi:hypothetical protein
MFALLPSGEEFQPPIEGNSAESVACKTHRAREFPGGLMRVRGRIWLVWAVVCLGLSNTRVDAATIALGTPLGNDSDLVLVPLAVTTESLVTLDLEAEFWPALTLFGPAPEDSDEVLFQGLQRILDIQPLDGNAIAFSQILPASTSYLIVISQSPNLFDPFPDPGFPGGWVADNDPEFISRFFDCASGFVDFSGNCGSGDYAATLTVQPTTVPEPGTLALLALGGGGALVARRRRKPDES